jgi:hypothetical protein
MTTPHPAIAEEIARLRRQDLERALATRQHDVAMSGPDSAASTAGVRRRWRLRVTGGKARALTLTVRDWPRVTPAPPDTRSGAA